MRAKFHHAGGDLIKIPASPKPSSITSGDGRPWSKKKHPSAFAIEASSAVGLIAAAAVPFCVWMRRTNHALLNAIEQGIFAFLIFLPAPSATNMEIDQYPAELESSSKCIHM